MADMIHRVAEHTRNYSVMLNEALQRDDMSARAKGLYAYIMTLPNDWKIHRLELFRHFTEGRDAMARAFKELIDKGYIKVERVRDEHKKFVGYDYRVYESSNISGFPVSGLPEAGSPSLLSTDLPLSTNKSSKGTEKRPPRFQSDFDEYWNAYPPTKNKVSKSTAYKAYIKKRDEGVTREDLLAALEIYKQECKGFSDSKYIRCPHRTIEQYTPPIQPKKEEEPVLKRFEHHVMAQIRKRDDGEDYDSALIDLYMDRDSDEAMEVYAKKWAETGDWR